MKVVRFLLSKTIARIALAVAAIGVGAGAAFGAWSEHGGEVFAAMIQTGLSWCM